jgi:hypothetical protein
MVLHETHQAQRREQATDARGLPSSYGRAVKAFDGACVHCSQRAAFVDGAGVGRCREHQREHRDKHESGIRARAALRRRIEVAKAWK